MKYLPLFLVVAIFVTPSLAGAQFQIVPDCEGASCDACHLIELGENLLDWLIGILMIIFAGMVAWGGFELVTSGGNPEAKGSAKRKLTNALIGIVIVLAAWLLIDTIMRALLPGNSGEIVGFGPWNKIECGKQTTTVGGAVITSTQDYVVTNGGLSGPDALEQLSGNEVDVVSSGACTNPGNATCTGIAGLQQSTVDAILQIDSDCPSCNIAVTAGTEVGHTNACHEAGTCVDIDCRPNDCTVDEIIKITSFATINGDNAIYEVSTAERRDELIAAGVDPAKVAVVTWITGEHFSLYAAQ